jgi:hypothetical protein
MLRLLLRPILLLTLLAALPIVLIRAQPYDDSDLRTFLTPPEGCPAPCFMGIRPGVTTVDEAVTILEGQEWVQSVRAFQGANDESDLIINWKQCCANQPAWLNYHTSALIEQRSGIVIAVEYALLIDLTVGDLYAALGKPESLSLVCNGCCCDEHLLWHLYPNLALAFETWHIDNYRHPGFIDAPIITVQFTVEFSKYRPVDLSAMWRQWRYPIR